MRATEPFAYFKRMTDAELESRIMELHHIMEAKALAAGHTVEQFRTAMDALYVTKGHAPLDWSAA